MPQVPYAVLGQGEEKVMARYTVMVGSRKFRVQSEDPGQAKSKGIDRYRIWRPGGRLPSVYVMKGWDW